jgi:ABC-type nitrate/sulfonate/bicarbonate transport system permease component
MAETRALNGARAANRRVLLLRLALIAGVLASWEGTARSGILFRDVVPPLPGIAQAIVTLLGSGEFYGHLVWTLGEICTALGLGIIAGLAVGMIVGSSRLFYRAYLPYLYYLGSTPKLIFFPVMIMLFGVGASSKIALGFISCFFPIALSTAEGLRQINPVFIRVGRSFRARKWHMVRHIYLPALKEPILTGIRLGMAVAIIATLLAETKLSNRGVGHLIIQAFTIFDMPRMYALLITIFAVAIAANTLLNRLSTNARRSVTSA